MAANINELNDMTKKLYMSMGIDEKVYDFCNEIWNGLEERFDKIRKVSEFNQAKVLKAMQDNKVSEALVQQVMATMI